jgi:Flp pilus assembly pilin Flp
MTRGTSAPGVKRNRFGRFQRDDRGAGMIETALSLAFVLLTVFAVMEMILLLYAYAVISGAAKEGVRYAIVLGSAPSGVWNRNENPTGCPFSDANAPIECKVWDYARYSLKDLSGSTLTVHVTFPSDGTATCPGAADLTTATALCPVRISVNYTYAPWFGVPLTPTLSAVAQGRMVN